MLLFLFNVFLLILEVSTLVINCVSILCDQVLKLFRDKPHKDVANKIILITGAGSGVGREMAIRFAKMNAILVLWDIERDLVTETANIIRRSGGIAHAMTVDVSDENKVEKSADHVKEEIGDVYMLINNAGVCPCLPFKDLTYKQIRRTFDVNCLSHFWTTKQFLPSMINNERGHIVAISSSAGIMGSAYFTAYGASKYGVVGLMASLDRELAELEKRDFIKLTTICPLGISGTRVDIPTRTRFPKILPVMTLEHAVDLIMDAILKEDDMVVIPFTFKFIYFVNRLFPLRMSNLLFEFLDYAVEPHGINAPIGRSHFNDLDYRNKWENQNTINHLSDQINKQYMLVEEEDQDDY